MTVGSTQRSCGPTHESDRKIQGARMFPSGPWPAAPSSHRGSSSALSSLVRVIYAMLPPGSVQDYAPELRACTVWFQQRSGGRRQQVPGSVAARRSQTPSNGLPGPTVTLEPTVAFGCSRAPSSVAVGLVAFPRDVASWSMWPVCSPFSWGRSRTATPSRSASRRPRGRTRPLGWATPAERTTSRPPIFSWSHQGCPRRRP